MNSHLFPAPTFPAFAGPKIFWCGAGPTQRNARVDMALSRKPPSHLDLEATRLMTEIAEMTRHTLGTANDLTTVLPFSGTGAVQMGLEALVRPGTIVVIGHSGGFAKRIEEIVHAIGGQPVLVENPGGFGAPLDVSAMVDALRGHPGAVFAFVLDETSTGGVSDAAALVRAAEERGHPVLIDAVTAAPGAHLQVDRLGKGDKPATVPLIVCSCGQKRYGGVPGVSPFTMNDLAVEFAKNRPADYTTPTWVYDFKRYLAMRNQRVYTFTTQLHDLAAMHEALRILCEIGLEDLWAMQARAGRAFETAIKAAGLEFYFNQMRSTALKAVRVPEQLGPEGMATVISKLREKCNIEISGSMGAFAGKFWRFGLLGPETLKLDSLILVMTGFIGVLQGLDMSIELDPVVEALRTAYEAPVL